MSGVVAAMRRTLLSCTSLARHGMLALATTLSTASEPALADDLSLAQVVSAWFDLNHQEFAVLTTALALVGFSVVASILLMRTRVRLPDRGSAALRYRRVAGPGRPVAGAVVRGTANPDFLGRG
jgi:hypothetical protein